MRLSRIEIKNHSRIQDLDLGVRRHAVIVGANDVGKSSILRMLNLLLGASTAGLYQSLTPADLRDLEQPLVVNAWWAHFTGKNRRPFPSEISIGSDQVSEYLWVQMIVEAHPEDEEAVTVRRRFPKAAMSEGPAASSWRSSVGATCALLEARR
ncbi:protein involved in chromosome condensation [Arthrobacter sp. Hiyo8]|nr:protein involved in chromosome condensation [Arthrobacter sp. Hiyo8]